MDHIQAATRNVRLGTSDPKVFCSGLLYQYLHWLGVAQEAQRAGGQAIGATLEYDNEVTDVCGGQLHLVGEHVERRA